MPLAAGNPSRQCSPAAQPGYGPSSRGIVPAAAAAWPSPAAVPSIVAPQPVRGRSK